MTVFHIFDRGRLCHDRHAPMYCSLYIQSLPTASEIYRGTETFDEIRRDSIPFRMRDVYTASRFCKVENSRTFHSSTTWRWSQPYTMASNHQFGARFQVEKKSHKIQLCGIDLPSPREYASLSSQSACFRYSANKQMALKDHLCVAPHAFHTYVAPDSCARSKLHHKEIQVGV